MVRLTNLPLDPTEEQIETWKNEMGLLAQRNMSNSEDHEARVFCGFLEIFLKSGAAPETAMQMAVMMARPTLIELFLPDIKA